MLWKKANREIRISTESLYVQLYEEMRRARNYQLQASSWYSAIMVGIDAVVLVTRQKPDFLSLLEKCLMLGVIITLLLSVSYVIWFEHVRYVERRRCVLAIEPTWINEQRKPLKVKPPVAWTLSNIALAVFASALVWVG